ncbi:hypothetical protein [Rhizobium sullae]|uniref:hypothetical protein n=1 Tax=Rhizobium sullae TaxID=50338 RepID=UPI001404CC65|nr:hypothetical protein [Rhizobium sullae]
MVRYRTLAILGATAEVTNAGLPYEVPQNWSKALSGHPVAADGIAYHGRHDNTELCFALFEPVRSAVSTAERRTDLDANWFWQMAGRYKIGLAS